MSCRCNKGFVGLFLIGLLWLVGPAHADLLISPTRVLVTDQQSIAQVTLRNTGAQARTYRMEWREMRRNDEGSYHIIENPGPDDRIASPMLRYSPRQISLAPGETQTVRIQYRPQDGLTPGEYRSHLRFTTVGGEEADPEPQPGERAQAIMRIGLAFSIPVIVRVGEPEGLEVRISRVQPRMETNQADGKTRTALDITLERSGTYSSFGDINIHMQERQDGPVVLVGKSTDFAIFADAAARPISVILRDDVAIPQGAWMRVSYDGKQEFAGRVLAEQVFQIQ